MDPIKSDASKTGSHHVNQIIAAIAVSFGPFAVGMGKGYTSPALASLQVRLGDDGRRIRTPSNTGSDLTITDQEGSWVASLSLLGALLGGIFSSLVLKYGRRRALLFVSLPFSLSWLLTTIASSVEMIYVTAFSVGFCSSIVQLATQVYISEIAHPSIRASLCSSSKVFSQVGLLTSFALGAWLNWRQLAIVCAIGPIMTFIAALNVPETPSFLVFNNQEKRAERSLRWLRGASYTHDVFDEESIGVAEELNTLQANIRRKKEQRSCCSKKAALSQLFGPLSITCGVMFFTRFSGVTAFNFYAVPIFRESFESFNPHLAAVLTGSVQLISSAMSGILCDLVGRLPLLVISSILMSGALAGFGVFSYFQRSAFIEASQGGALLSYAHHDWIPLACVVTFVAAFSLGLNPISWLLIGEVFPLEYRSLGPAITTSFGYICAFIGVKTFVDLRAWLGLFGTFWTYAVIAAVGLLFTLAFVPETKGMSLDEMEPKTCSILKDDQASKV